MIALDPTDRALLAALEDGLPIDPRPYRTLGERLGLAEEDVIVRLRRLIEQGVVRRFGVVVRHRALGFTANAMVVWDIADEHTDAAARSASACPFVTLCYRRPRRDGWRYNLFCMIHGRERQAVLGQVDQLRTQLGAAVRDYAVLFSTRAFKQQGARYGTAQVLREPA